MSFIDAHDFPAGLVLRVLGVAESTYYDWRARQVTPSRRELDDAALLEQILKIRGVQRVRRHLRLPAGLAGAAPPGRAGRAQARGAAHAHPRAAGRAPAAGLEATARPGRTRTTPPRRTWSNATSGPTAPNRLWVADLTRLVTGEGVLWLASVRDAFANRIVGWATDPRATTTLVLTALNHALRSREVRAGQLIFHSD